MLIVGGGSIGNKHAQICKNVIPSAVVTLCKVTGSAVKTRNPFVDHYVYGVEEALKCEADAVIIASPATLHLAHIFHFSEMTPHILVEKPLCWNVSELEGLSPREIGYLNNLQVGYVLRFAPCLTELSELMRAEVAGHVMFANVWAGQHLSAWRPGQLIENTVSASRSLGGGVLAELSHEIDYTTFLLGRPHSYAGDIRKVSYLTKDVPDYASLQLQYDQFSVSMQLDFLRHSPSLGMEIICEQGELVCDFAQLTGRQYDATVQRWIDFKSNGVVLEFNDLYRWQLDCFLTRSFPDYEPRFKSLWSGSSPAFGADAIEVVRIISKLMDEEFL